MARTGPFGLGMSMSVAEFDGGLEEIGPGKYRALTVPKPHSAFELYVLQITPQTGLSWIKAVGKTVETSVYGYELKSSFDVMKNKLSATYGKSDTLDFLMTGSIWNEPRDWMQAMLNRERVLMEQWAPKYGSQLGNSLDSISLFATAQGTSSGYIAIEYSFENIKNAEGEIAALEDDAL